LIEVNLLAQRRGECLDSFDRLPITNVETPLNAFLGIHTHRIKHDRPGERSGDQDDMRYNGTRMYEQLQPGDNAVVDERQADREQEVDRRTIEKHIEYESGNFEVVALELHSGEVHEYGKKEEFNIRRYEDRQQGE
jgi:hypothetical protein